MEESSEFFDVPTVNTLDPGKARERIGGSSQGYCEIWRYDRSGRFRVLKCLKKEYRGLPLYESLLRKEFETGYSLSHRNICEYYSFLTDPQLGSCIEMEWVDGRTLKEFLSEKKQERAVCDKIAAEICDALSYMHAKQVLHKDLKPTNILVTYNGDNVKVIDFGVSDSDSSSVLKIPAGTLAYAAPEVRAGGKATVRSDLYSLGMVLSLFPSRKCSRVARRLCSSRPERRYSSAQEVAEALKAKGFVFQGFLFIFLIALMALIPLFDKVQPGSKKSEVPASDVTDTVAVAPAMPVEDSTSTEVSDSSVRASSLQPVSRKGSGKAVPSKGSASKEKPPQAVPDQEVIDELFRQATEMFE